MNFGISTACFYPMYTEQALQELIDNNVKTIEIFLNTYSELKPDYIRSLKAQLNSANVNVTSVHPFTSLHESGLFFSDYDRRFQDGIEQYKSYFNFMNEVGAKFLVFHGCLSTSPCPDELYFERFGKLSEAAKKQGVILAQENVAPFKSGKLDFLLRLNEYLRGSGHFVLDIKQTIRAGQNIFEMVEKLGRNIVHVHASDNSSKTDCAPIGSGCFDFMKLFSLLDRKGFSGNIMLELYRSNYGEYSELYDSLHNLEWMYLEKLSQST